MNLVHKVMFCTTFSRQKSQRHAIELEYGQFTKLRRNQSRNCRWWRRESQFWTNILV